MVANGNQMSQQLSWQETTMTDEKNGMNTSADDMKIQTYTYDGDGQKRSENKNGVVTTLIWDGTDYLGEI
jgi:YD repeat-containing protein